ncbi:general stress protein [Allorhodopirellula solitaria]|uniref:general stress protein n=1 Tax=Allorhodopirellula solitaria TaxID=2527987 RepID=UPI0016464CA6|nr:general stress protein [Allorhodopirellula solitaria]
MSNVNNRETVVAAFHSVEDAQAAIHRLKEAGFTEEQIGVVSHGERGTLPESLQFARRQR